jgi:hypothetical protein
MYTSWEICISYKIELFNLHIDDKNGLLLQQFSHLRTFKHTLDKLQVTFILCGVQRSSTLDE